MSPIYVCGELFYMYLIYRYGDATVLIYMSVSYRLPFWLVFRYPLSVRSLIYMSISLIFYVE